jgi:hypothetical protein
MPTINLAVVSEPDPLDMSRAAAQRQAARDFDPTWQARRANTDDLARRERAAKSPRDLVDQRARKRRQAEAGDAERPQRREGGE